MMALSAKRDFWNVVHEKKISIMEVSVRIHLFVSMKYSIFIYPSQHFDSVKT